MRRLLSGTDWPGFFEKWTLAPWAVFPSARACLAHAGRAALVLSLGLGLSGCGRWAMRRMGLRTGGPCEEWTLGFALGYGLWGTLLLLLGLAGLWSKPVLAALFAAAVLLGAGFGLLGVRFIPLAPGAPPTPAPRLGPASWAALAAVAASWLYASRYALVPETFYDALHYHLALPSIYLAFHRILPLPEHSFSGVPSLPEMINGWTLALDPWGIGAGLLHASMVLWISAAFLALSARLGRPRAGPLAAAAFYAGSPVVLGESIRLSVGLEWALMQLCCLSCFFAALSEEPGSRARRAWLALGGTFLGFALCVKYPAWAAPAAFAGAALLFRKSPPEDSCRMIALRELALFLACSGFWVLPWVLKNLVHYHNPVFPFLHKFFVPLSEHLPDQVQPVFSGVQNPWSLPFAQWLKAYAEHPWLFLKSSDIAESVGPFALAFLPLPFLVPMARREKMLAWLCAGLWIPLSLASLESRFFIPHLAVLALLLACLADKAGGFLPGLGLGLSLAAGLAAMTVDAHRAKLEVFLGRKSFGEYLRRAVVSYPTPPYAGIEFVESRFPEGAAVLLYGESRSFYFKRRVFASSSDQVPLLEAWANSSRDAGELRRRLRERGIGAIVANVAEMSRRGSGPRLTERGREVLFAFWRRYALRVFDEFEPRDHWVRAYRVLEEEEASRPHPVDDLFFPASGGEKL
jgi:hypothetical protein